MILTDSIHLMSNTSTDELHTFAQSIGLRREWFQAHNEHPHYDLTTRHMAQKAKKAGAVEVATRTLLTACRKKGAKE